jgi:hypothetical protein
MQILYSAVLREIKTSNTVLDSGNTFSIISHNKGFIKYTAILPEVIHTISGTASFVGEGSVCCDIKSEEGKFVQIQIPCKHLPLASTCRLSPKDYCQCYQLDCFQDQ